MAPERKHYTPSPELAAFIAAHRAHVSYDGRAEDVPATAPITTDMPAGTYRVNADGTLTRVSDE